ncbi:hypothetical protein [Photobacterium sanguinicancri]|uniref:hypothetical protein n=1 Tax=Photobacterium sanguinicancri TaxID=875932 RepID=UPI003D0E8CE0
MARRNKNALMLGESFSSKELYGAVEDYPVYKPTRHQLANPPHKVITYAEGYGHATATFWCLTHGDWYTEWKVHRHIDRVDFASCQCTQCIEEGIYSHGASVIG